MASSSYTVHLAADHAGVEQKQAVKTWLEAAGYQVLDHGAHIIDHLDDFPDYVALAALAVSRNPASTRAIIFGGSGQGEAMVANRFPSVRATVYYGGSEEIITLSREHNDANILSVGARFVTTEALLPLIERWLTTPFLADAKYERRNQKIERHNAMVKEI